MTINTRQFHGFTLVELLVIVAVLALAASSVVVIVGSLRFKGEDIQKLHDARRLSDMNQLRTGLDLFYANAGGYPDQNNWATGQVLNCGKVSIFQVPVDPLASNYYIYRGKGTSHISTTCGGYKVWTEYALEFRTETKSALGPAGLYCLTPNKGISAGSCR